jgi:hypothetical protein
MDQKSFMTTCKSHFQNKERLKDHETTHKKQRQIMKRTLTLFLKNNKVHTPELSDPKFFDFLNIDIHPRFNLQYIDVWPL